MIVTRQEARRIEGGRKTKHRFALSRKPLDPGAVVPITYRVPNEGLGYEDGRPKMEPRRAIRVQIMLCEQVDPVDATDADARAEGYRSLDELQAEWIAPSWRVSFEAIREHRPRFLSKGVIAGRVGDYVDTPARALANEPEAVDDLDQARFAREARDRDRARDLERRQHRLGLTFDEQVRALASEARARHIDVRDQLRAIERWKDPVVRAKQLAHLRTKVERGAAA